MKDDAVDQVNRFIVVVGAMLLAFVALLVVLLAWGAWSDAAGRIEDFGGWLADNDDTDSKLIVTLFAAVVVLLMITAIIVELTPSPLEKMRVRNVKTGDATITTVEIAGRIEQEARGVEHVAGCKATVAARGRKVDVLLDLHVDAGADLARTADEACRRAQDLVERSMGIALASPPRARMRYRELRLRIEEPKRAQAEATAAQTGWERPRIEGTHDERANTDTTEEAQAEQA